MNNAREELAPVKSKVVVDQRRAPWYDKKLSDARKKRRRAERQMMKDNLQVHIQIFKEERGRYTKLVDDAKANYHCNMIVSADTKKLFNIVDSVNGEKKITSSTLPSSIPLERHPDAFLNFFVKKVAKLRNLITPQPLSAENVFRKS